MFNSTTIIGRLVKDPEPRTSNNGANTCLFTVAVDNFGKDNGASFFNCLAFSKTAEFAGNYLGKGRLVCVSGRMESNKGSDGKTYWTLKVQEVKALDRVRDDAPAQPTQTARTYSPPASDEYDPFRDE